MNTTCSFANTRKSTLSILNIELMWCVLIKVMSKWIQISRQKPNKFNEIIHVRLRWFHFSLVWEPSVKLLKINVLALRNIWKIQSLHFLLCLWQRNNRLGFEIWMKSFISISSCLWCYETLFVAASVITPQNENMFLVQPQNVCQNVCSSSLYFLRAIVQARLAKVKDHWAAPLISPPLVATCCRFCLNFNFCRMIREWDGMS